MAFSLRALAVQIPISDVQDLAAEMMSRGLGKDAIVSEIVDFLDGLIAWDTVVKGPAGAAAEASDGPILRAVVRVIVGSLARRNAA